MKLPRSRLCLALASIIALGFTAEYAKADARRRRFRRPDGDNLCSLGIKIFPRPDERLSALALLGGVGIGVTAIVLSFESTWHMSSRRWNGQSVAATRILALAIELLFPLAAVCLAAWGFFRKQRRFSCLGRRFSNRRCARVGDYEFVRLSRIQARVARLRRDVHQLLHAIARHRHSFARDSHEQPCSRKLRSCSHRCARGQPFLR